MASVVENLLSILETLCSIFSTAKKKKKSMDIISPYLCFIDLSRVGENLIATKNSALIV
jgi:hypothetical protein